MTTEWPAPTATIRRPIGLTSLLWFWRLPRPATRGARRRRPPRWLGFEHRSWRPPGLVEVDATANDSQSARTALPCDRAKGRGECLLLGADYGVSTALQSLSRLKPP